MFAYGLRTASFWARFDHPVGKTALPCKVPSSEYRIAGGSVVNGRIRLPSVRSAGAATSADVVCCLASPLEVSLPDFDHPLHT